MQLTSRSSFALVFGALTAPPALVGQAGPPATLTTEAIAAQAVRATVTIVTFGPAGDTLGLGSGFLVRSTGVIVTNYHVMNGAAAAIVVLASGERYDRVEALGHDEAADLAVLKIPGLGLPVLPTSATVPPVGARLVAVGNPLGLTRTVSEGIVSAVRLVAGRELVQMSAAISPGSSGGPVLNGQGEVVAVATSYLADGQNLNFAVPVRYAMGLVEGAGVPGPLGEQFGKPPATPWAQARAEEAEALAEMYKATDAWKVAKAWAELGDVPGMMGREEQARRRAEEREAWAQAQAWAAAVQRARARAEEAEAKRRP